MADNFSVELAEPQGFVFSQRAPCDKAVDLF